MCIRDRPSIWQEALTALRVIRQLISASSDEMLLGVNSYLDHIENMIFRYTNSHTRVTTINEFFLEIYLNIK